MVEGVSVKRRGDRNPKRRAVDDPTYFVLTIDPVLPSTRTPFRRTHKDLEEHDRVNPKCGYATFV